MPLYTVAGITVSMSPQYPLSQSRANPYRCENGVAQMTVVGAGDEYEEYAALASSFYEQLIGFDGFLLHASAVEYNGQAVAFSASSGTGKSTHSSFWCKELGAKIINDDKPALRRMDGVFYACGTPFSGKRPLSRNVCVPLKAIVFLTRAPQTSVRRLPPQEALFRLLSQTLRPQDAVLYERLLGLIEDLMRQVEFYEAGVPNDPACAYDVKKALGV